MRKGSGLSARRYRIAVKLKHTYERLLADLEGWRGDIIMDDLHYQGSTSGTFSSRLPSFQQLPVIRPDDLGHQTMAA